MQQISRVLVAVDFSKPARSAFESALALSERHSAELVALQVVPLDQAFGWRARERYALAAKFRRMADLANVEFADIVEQGDPAKIIVSHADSLRPDLIVVGTHQRAGIDRFLNGSVAERVAAKSSVPVLVVPLRGNTVAVHPFSHLAVAVDFTAAANRAIEQALALARDPADRLTFLHLVPDFPSVAAPYSYGYGIAEYQDDVMQDAQRRVQLAVAAMRNTPAAVDIRVLPGSNATQISRVVDTVGADLLVVGVPTRGAVARAVFGSTAARVLPVSRVPVLAVPEGGTATAHRPLQLAA